MITTLQIDINLLKKHQIKYLHHEPTSTSCIIFTTLNTPIHVLPKFI